MVRRNESRGPMSLVLFNYVIKYNRKKGGYMKHKNMTFSIPDDLKALLFTRVGNRNRSQFISNSIRKALEEEESELERELDIAYEAANQDSSRIEVLQDWDEAEDNEWINDDDDDWSWLKKENGKK
jgi:hypothetical protein